MHGNFISLSEPITFVIIRGERNDFQKTSSTGPVVKSVSGPMRLSLPEIG
jgi:hypothetical protein